MLFTFRLYFRVSVRADVNLFWKLDLRLKQFALFDKHKINQKNRKSLKTRVKHIFLRDTTLNRSDVLVENANHCQLKKLYIYISFITEKRQYYVLLIIIIYCISKKEYLYFESILYLPIYVFIYKCLSFVLYSFTYIWRQILSSILLISPMLSWIRYFIFCSSLAMSTRISVLIIIIANCTFSDPHKLFKL